MPALAATRPYTARGLGYDPDTLQRIIEDRKTAQARAHDATPQLTLEDAMRGNKNAVKDKDAPGVIEAIPIDESTDRNSPDEIRTVSAYGTNADYLTRRIARDHPAILDRMKAGEFPSVRAAAKEAGLVTERVRYEQ